METIERSRPDTERIERVLNLVEHVWKLYPRWSFGQVIEEVVGLDHGAPEHFCLARISDTELEVEFRDFLRKAFSGSRDAT